VAVTGGYVPPYAAGAPPITLAVSAAVLAGQVVEVTGDNTVGPAGAASRKAIGVAGQSGSAVGDLITVYLFGDLHTMTASGAITAGDQVGTAAAGAVSTIAAGTTTDLTRSIVGVALAGIANGQTGRIMVGPF
jgi:hypothetical protein